MTRAGVSLTAEESRFLEALAGRGEMTETEAAGILGTGLNGANALARGLERKGLVSVYLVEHYRAAGEDGARSLEEERRRLETENSSLLARCEALSKRCAALRERLASLTVGDFPERAGTRMEAE